MPRHACRSLPPLPKLIGMIIYYLAVKVPEKRALRARYRFWTSYANSVPRRIIANWRQKHALSLRVSPKSQHSSPFFRLPPELRARIFLLALHTGQASSKGEPIGNIILQPGARRRHMHLDHFAPYPSTWKASQRIRSDSDAPSTRLARLLACEVSASKSQGRYPDQFTLGTVSPGLLHPYLRSRSWQGAPGWEKMVRFRELMTICAEAYMDILPLLYSRCTISFFGAEMVPYFVRYASPDGIRCIRNVHIAMRLDATRWQERHNRNRVVEAVSYLMLHFPSLQQLDVEVAITWGPPQQPGLFWKWLMDDVFGLLSGLDEFVLKVSVLTALPKARRDRSTWSDWTPAMSPLSSWSADDYERLKKLVTEGHESQ